MNASDVLDLTVGQIAGGTAVAGALVVLGFIVRKVLPLLRRTAHFLDDWFGESERPGVPARPGVMERIGNMEHELRPNGGESLKDAVNRIDVRSLGREAQLASLDGQVKALASLVGSLIEQRDLFQITQAARDSRSDD